MATPFTAVEDFWDWLGTQSDYTDLALNEFRTLDGNVLPIDQNGLVRSDQLPAIFVGEFVPVIEKAASTPARDVFGLELRLQLLYGAASSLSAHTAASLWTALVALVDILGARGARAALMAYGSQLIDSVEYEMGTFREVFPPGGSKDVLFWRGGFNVTLKWRRALPI